MQQNTRDFKGVWIPKDIYLNNNLSWTEKILLTEIDSLDNGNGCWASNSYFAKFLNKSESQIANSISKLRKDGLIIDRFFDGRKRYISVNSDLRKTRRQGYGKPEGRVTENRNEFEEKDQNYGLTEPQNNDDVVPNNTINNTYKMKTAENAVFSSDIQEVKLDEYGVPIKEIKKESKPPVDSSKNKLALKIRAKFSEMAYSRLGIKPVADVKGYKMVLFALNTAKLTEGQIYDLFDEWFDLPKPEEDLISITKSLSARQIEQYKIRNNVK